jgi:BNR repeat-containing family member
LADAPDAPVTATGFAVSRIADNAYWKSGINVNGTSQSRCFTDTSGNSYQAYYDTILYVHVVKNGVDYPTTLKASGDDEHFDISLVVDSTGYIHVWWGMHATALNYAVSSNSNDPSAFTTVSLMVNSGPEANVTYPMGFISPSGTLYFTYRFGGSGNGDQYLYVYNTSTKTWSAAAGTNANGFMIDGGDFAMSAYLDGIPRFDSNGVMWFAFSIRSGGSGGTNFNKYLLGYTGSSFIKYGGASIAAPIYLNSYPSILTVTGASYGSMYGYAIDGNNKHHITYTVNDGSGNTQIYSLSDVGGSWVSHQITSWTLGGLTTQEVQAIPLIASTGHILIVAQDWANNRISVFDCGTNYSSITSSALPVGFSQNWECNYDPQAIKNHIVRFTWMDANDYQYGTEYISKTATPWWAGQLYKVDWSI